MRRSKGAPVALALEAAVPIGEDVQDIAVADSPAVDPAPAQCLTITVVQDPVVPHAGERWTLADGRAVTVHAVMHRRAFGVLAVRAEPDGAWLDAAGAVPVAA